MSKAKNLPIAEDIYQRQEKIIEEQREQINNLNRHISYLESVQAEFDEFKAAFNGNGLTTFNQAMQVILTRRNAEVERERQRRNYEKQSQRELEEVERHDAEVKAILAENPCWQSTIDERKAKVQQIKEKTLQLANRFYDMSTEEARQYIEIPHKPDKSAVKYLLLLHQTEHQGEKGTYITEEYECECCGDRSYNLDEFERHCYLHAELKLNLKK